MRQVPKTEKPYLIIGNGKLAKNLCHYFDLKQIPHTQWHRQQKQNALIEQLENCSKVLLCISDSAIEHFAMNLRRDFQHLEFVHFSGSLIIDGIENLHPMHSFALNFPSLQVYEEIPFAYFHKEKSLKDLLPELENPSFYMPQEKKSEYHAHCASAGNLAQWLWHESYDFFKENSIPKEAFRNFILASLDNFLEQGREGVSGPISRNDQTTIQKNIDDIKNQNLKETYRFFAKKYSSWKEQL
ncbi:MAG: DUF2520 domain-containing protein [Bdellovibrionota bacterium]|nr:DUF2520 domain-containing protein [Bdellovibrionota bacterium]